MYVKRSITKQSRLLPWKHVQKTENPEILRKYMYDSRKPVSCKISPGEYNQ